MDESNPIRYERDRLTGPQLQEAVDEILANLRVAEDLDALAASAGSSADEVRSISVRISESESSIDPATTFILVHVAGGALSAAGGGGAALFWKKVILPRVRKSKGGDAIGEERPDTG